MSLYRKKRVVVLGCGPAGLFAAHAAKQSEADVHIISKKRRSEMYGAQYLHSGIPGLTDDQRSGQVEYRLTGDLDDYLKKVYGTIIPDRSAITRESLVGTYPAWDIRRAYHQAFETYCDHVINHVVEADTLVSVLTEFRPDLLVSTVPAPALCAQPGVHAFDVRRIWAIGDAPERGVFTPRYSAEPNIIWYNGEDSPAWYRYSFINGYAAMEWPESNRPPVEDVAVVDKPVATTCDCWMNAKKTRVIRLGRYGAWSRHGHSHQAYWRTLTALKEL
jgi:hypothetical protein